MDFHYCQGELQNISFFKKAKNCHEKVTAHHCQKVKKACHKSPKEDGIAKKNKNCCDNEAFFFQLESDYGIHSIVDAESNDNLFEILDPSLSEETILHSFYNPKDYKYYKPPSLARDHIVLFQSYLI